MSAVCEVTLPRTGAPVLIGGSAPTRVMALIGTTSRADECTQDEKVCALLTADDPPEVVCDLSVRRVHQPLWRSVAEDGRAVAAALPIYTVRRRGDRIDPVELLEVALGQIEGGVGLLTIHPTPTRELVELARGRLVPWTSRGGGLVISDLLARDETENAYERILPELAAAARRAGCALSLGASFRSATIFDALDRCQRSEITRQLDLAASLSAAGVQTIVESPGHARPTDIARAAAMLRAAEHPVMPLGPIPTDAAIGEDHVSAAIGATLFGLAGCAQIIAAVTREEHTGGVPRIESTLEAVRAARVAGHVIDLELHGHDELDAHVAGERAAHRTCVATRQHAGCSRCGPTCPL